MPSAVPPSLQRERGRAGRACVTRRRHRNGPVGSACLVAAFLACLCGEYGRVADAKKVVGTTRTSSCFQTLATFQYGSESNEEANLVITIEVPDQYENVWLVAIDDTIVEATDTTACSYLLDVVTAQAMLSLGLVSGGRAVDFLSYSATPDFPRQIKAMRLYKGTGTFEELYDELVGFNRSSVASTCGGSLADVNDGVCDAATNTAGCGWDGGDCCIDTCFCEPPECSAGCGSSGYNCLRPIDTVTDDTCDCCGDTSTPGYESFAVLGKVDAWKTLTIAMINVDLTACEEAGTAYPYCQGPLMNISYSVDFLNAEEGTVFANLSNNDVELLIFCFVLCPLYILPVALASLVSRELKKLEKYHWTARLLMYSIYLAFASQLLWLIDLVLMSATGVGAVIENDFGADVRVFRVAGLMVFFLADTLLLTVGVGLAKGWSVVRRKLSARSRIIYGSMLCLYVLICLTAVVWSGATATPGLEESTVFFSDPGYMQAAIRLFIYLGFVWAFSTTLKKFQAKRRFFQKLFALFSIWILFQPLAGLLIASAGLCYGTIAAAMFLTQFLFLLMFWPNQKFNSGFPFHIRTTQMGDAAERAAQDELDTISGSSDGSNGGEVSDETRKRMDEVRAATNPLTRSRVILQKMQGDISNLMMFSTELGRALEEMQTKDDDPDSGEELEDLEARPTEAAFGSEHAAAIKAKRAREREAAERAAGDSANGGDSGGRERGRGRGRRGRRGQETEVGVEMAEVSASSSGSMRGGRRGRRVVQEDDDGSDE